MAWVNINGRRLPTSAIKEYTDPKTLSKVTNKLFVQVRIYKAMESFYFETIEEKEKFLLYLDKALGVKEV